MEGMRSQAPSLPCPIAVLLDLDNTVYTYAPCHRAGMATAAATAAGMDDRWVDAGTFKADYARARDAAKRRIRHTGAAHCRLLYFKSLIETRVGRTDIDAICRLHDAYWDGYLSAMVLDVGCRVLLDAWRAVGVRTAWVSDFTTERQMLKLRHLGLGDAVDFLVTAEETGAVKPDAGGIDLALEKLGVASSKSVWFVGDDHERDLGAARARGLTAIWFRRNAETTASIAPDATVDSWAELAALWRG